LPLDHAPIEVFLFMEGATGVEPVSGFEVIPLVFKEPTLFLKLNPIS